MSIWKNNTEMYVSIILLYMMNKNVLELHDKFRIKFPASLFFPHPFIHFYSSYYKAPIIITAYSENMNGKQERRNLRI